MIRLLPSLGRIQPHRLYRGCRPFVSHNQPIRNEINQKTRPSDYIFDKDGNRFPLLGLHLLAKSRLPPPLRPGSDQPEYRDLVNTVLGRFPQYIDKEEAEQDVRWIIDETRDVWRRNGESEDKIDEEIRARVERRSWLEPIQYILGDVDFGGLTIKCKAPALIPRPETAYITERFAKEIKSFLPRLPNTSNNNENIPNLNYLDLCTGSGCIAFLMEKILNHRLRFTVGVDYDPGLVKFAESNSQDLNSKAKFIVGNVYEKKIQFDLTKRFGAFDFITSNPPYIPRGEYFKGLHPSVRAYEHRAALEASWCTDRKDGIGFYDRISTLLPYLLTSERELLDKGIKPGSPRIMFEVHHMYAAWVCKIMKEQSLGTIKWTEILKDQFGRDRAVVGYTSHPETWK